MSTKVGYKVLDTRRHSFSSILVKKKYREGPRYLHYPKGKKVTPEEGCGPLCIFSTLLRAELFAKDWASRRKHKLSIVKCKYERSEKDNIWTRDYKWSRFSYSLPEGTVLAKSVTCIE